MGLTKTVSISGDTVAGVTVTEYVPTLTVVHPSLGCPLLLRTRLTLVGKVKMNLEGGLRQTGLLFFTGMVNRRVIGCVN